MVLCAFYQTCHNLNWGAVQDGGFAEIILVCNRYGGRKTVHIRYVFYCRCSAFVELFLTCTVI